MAIGISRRTAFSGLAVVGLVVAACGQGDLEERTRQAAEALDASGQGVGVSTSEGIAGSRPPERAPETRRPTADRPVDLTDLGYTFGDPEAPVRIIEFSDFGCGYCRRFHMESYPDLIAEYVETGKVAWQYVPYVLGIFPHGLESATAGECAVEQEMLQAFGARMFEDQAEWKNEQGAVRHIFVRYAREEGLDADRFEQCLDEDWRRDQVRQNILAGGRLGVRGTPTFFIPGYQPLQGALPKEIFQQILEYVLSEDAEPAQ
jgi:protein-disulfide isomerase